MMAYPSIGEVVEVRQRGKYIYLGESYNPCLTYTANLNCWRANLLGKFFAVVVRFVYRNIDWVVRYDLESLPIEEGRVSPWWSGTWWMVLPLRFFNRFATKIDSLELI